MESANPGVQCVSCERDAELKATRTVDGDDQLNFHELPTAPREDLEAYARAVESGYFVTTYHDALYPEDDDIIVLLNWLKAPLHRSPEGTRAIILRLDRSSICSWDDAQREVARNHVRQQRRGVGCWLQDLLSTLPRLRSRINYSQNEKALQRRHRLCNARRQDRSISSRAGGKTAKPRRQSCRDAIASRPEVAEGREKSPDTTNGKPARRDFMSRFTKLTEMTLSS
ncbi:hypothetical protein LTR93_011352 [Exophiala xenobiotica]|nr:hypothetical protein LTR93_011352 [Exophiala xenobiotica]